MSDQWLYSRQGKQNGPVSPVELKRLASIGEILPEDLIWKEGMVEWAPARRLKGLFVTPSGVSAPPPLPPEASTPPPVISQPFSPDIASLRQFASGIHKQRIAIIGAATVGMLATFFPWVHAPIIGSLSGTAGDGWITLALFLPAMVLALRGDRTLPLLGPYRMGAAIPAGIASSIGLYKAIGFRAHMSNMPQDNPFAQGMSAAIHIGIGLYLLIVSGISLAALAWWLVKTPEERQRVRASLLAQFKSTNDERPGNT